MQLRKIIGLLLIIFFVNVAWGQTSAKKTEETPKKAPRTEQKKIKRVPSAHNKKKVMQKQRTDMQKKRLKTAIRKKQALHRKKRR